jgi:hypothetical protein
MSEISDAQEANTENKKVYKKAKREIVEVNELITELRHKFITILKSLYWEHFEKGQCQPSSVTILIESADRALDHENEPMKDWTFLNSYIISDSFLMLITSLAKIPGFGRLFRSYLFSYFS